MEYYKLNIENIKKNIPNDSTGAYFLGYEKNKKFFIKYIGRSDTRLRSRLIDHVKNEEEEYTHFNYQITKTLLDAYKIECREWHNDFELDNKIHPRKPKNLDYKCPYCKKEDGGYTKWQLKNKE